MLGARPLAAVIALGIAMSACALWSRIPLDPSVGPDEVVVRVDNDGTFDVNVYALDSESAYRLGFVSAHSSKELSVPARLLTAESLLQLSVQPVAGARAPFRLPAVQVGAGQKVALTVTNDPAHSSIAIVPPGLARKDTVQLKP